jgi:hypothetical protein
MSPRTAKGAAAAAATNPAACTEFEAHATLAALLSTLPCLARLSCRIVRARDRQPQQGDMVRATCAAGRSDVELSGTEWDWLHDQAIGLDNSGYEHWLIFCHKQC